MWRVLSKAPSAENIFFSSKWDEYRVWQVLKPTSTEVWLCSFWRTLQLRNSFSVKRLPLSPCSPVPTIPQVQRPEGTQVLVVLCLPPELVVSLFRAQPIPFGCCSMGLEFRKDFWGCIARSGKEMVIKEKCLTYSSYSANQTWMPCVYLFLFPKL